MFGRGKAFIIRSTDVRKRRRAPFLCAACCLARSAAGRPWSFIEGQADRVPCLSSRNCDRRIPECSKVGSLVRGKFPVIDRWGGNIMHDVRRKTVLDRQCQHRSEQDGLWRDDIVMKCRIWEGEDGALRVCRRRQRTTKRTTVDDT
jgi:hypothetical protein